MDRNSTINERIKLLMEYYGLNMNSFTRRIGLHNNTIIGKIMQFPNRKPSYDTIVRIMNSFPKVSCRWLLTGEGTMFAGLDDYLPNSRDRILHIMNRFRLTVPQLSIKTNISAQEYQEIIDGNKQPSLSVLDGICFGFSDINPDWIYKNKGSMLKNDAESDFTNAHTIKFFNSIKNGFSSQKPDVMMVIHGFDDCQVSTFFAGDSLNQILTPGDIIICKNSDTSIIMNGDPYVLVTRSGTIIRLATKEGDSIRMFDNRLPDVIVHTKDITEIYQIKGVIKRLAI